MDIIPKASKIPRMVLTNKGLIVDYDALKSYIGAPALKQLLADLTLTKKKFAGRDRTIILISKIFKIVKIPRGDKVTTLLTLPRFFEEWVTPFNYELTIKNEEGPIKLPPTTFQTTAGKETLVLKDYQQVIHDHLINTIYKPDLPIGNNSQQDKLSRGCVLVLDTGRGKTYTAGALIRTLGLKTLVIAHNSRGAAEWDKMLKNYPQLKVGYYLTNKKSDGDVVIMIINSAMRPNFDFPKKKVGRQKRKSKSDDEENDTETSDLKSVLSRDSYFKQFGFIIYDEVPEYLSEKRRTVFWDTNFKYVLGLTATPDENLNDWDPIYKMHLGPLVFAEEIPGFSVDNVQWDFTVRVINYYGPPEFTEQKKSEKTGSTVCAWMADQFVADPYRNRMIMDLVAEFYNEGHHTYIFAEKRSILTTFAQRIREYLQLEVYIPEEDSEVKSIMGGATDFDVSDAALSSRIILTTYQYGSRGLSIGKMTRGIALTPRRHGMRQVCGRLTRADGDTTIPRIWIDVCDRGTTQKDQLRDRINDYNKKGYTVEQEDCSYEDIDIGNI